MADALHLRVKQNYNKGKHAVYLFILYVLTYNLRRWKAKWCILHLGSVLYYTRVSQTNGYRPNIIDKYESHWFLVSAAVVDKGNVSPSLNTA